MDREFTEKISVYEDLINSMQEELELYKQEHVGLRNEVYNVVEDNKKLSDQAKKANEFRAANAWAPDAKLDDIAANLQGQIQMLVQENRNLDNIWKLSKETIAELEKEIVQYRNLLNSPNSILQLKDDYEKKIRELEARLQTIMNESDRVRTANNRIMEEKLANEEKICELMRRLNELNDHEQRLSEKQREIQEIQSDNRRLVEELEKMKKKANDSLRREKDALQKMQEALQLAELAATRKETAEEQFFEIKEEYDKLVTVLGEVMRDAGRQVDEKVQRMKAKYKDQIKRIKGVLDKSLDELKKERQTRVNICGQAEQLQTKLMDALKGSQLLDQDLYEATQNIVAMELKISAYEKIIGNSELVKTMNEKRIGDLERFLEENKALKDKWSLALDEMMVQFQVELNEIASSQLMSAEDRDGGVIRDNKLNAT